MGFICRTFCSFFRFLIFFLLFSDFFLIFSYFFLIIFFTYFLIFSLYFFFSFFVNILITFSLFFHIFFYNFFNLNFLFILLIISLFSYIFLHFSYVQYIGLDLALAHADMPQNPSNEPLPPNPSLDQVFLFFPTVVTSNSYITMVIYRISSQLVTNNNHQNI